MQLLNELAQKISKTKNKTKLAKDIKSLYNLDGSSENIRKFISIFKQILDRDNYDTNELKLVKETEDNNGNWTKVRGLRKDDDFAIDETMFEVVGVTSNSYGGKWLRYEKKKPESLDVESIIKGIDLNSFKKATHGIIETNETKIYCITDLHIGMSTRGSMYSQEWNKTELYKRLDTLISYIDTSKAIVINQLGDFTDGMRNKTARGGNDLVQNMNDKEQFETGLNAIMYVLKSIAQSGVSVKVNWVTNSNHPYVLDYLIGLAAKRLCAAQWDNVEFNVLEDFISITGQDGHNFALSHGYDEEFMKKGLPLFLSPEHRNRLIKFFAQKRVDNPILLRGDRHQYKDVANDYFRDIVVPAFSPPSGWISVNFMSNNAGGFLIIDPTKDLNVKLVKF